MEIYSGTCSGGPWHGQKLAHSSKFKPLMRDGGHDLNAVAIGEYRLNDFAQWNWWPTEEGRAMDILFGKPTP